MAEDNPWSTLGSKTVYKNPWITVREDDVICPDGSKGIYGIVEGPLAAAVLAVNDTGEVYLIGQYRYPTRSYSWEIVCGGAAPEEAPLEAAKRELKEEAGLIAAEWEQLGGEIHTSNCFTTERAIVYLARNLSETESNPDSTEVLQVKRIPFKNAYDMAIKGEIQDAISLIAIMRAASFL